MKTIEQQLDALQAEKSQELENHVTQDEFTLWKNHRVTRLLFMDIAEAYLGNMLSEATSVPYLERVGRDEFLPHTNAVEETAIKCAIKSGRNNILEAFMNYQPENLVEDGNYD